MLLEFRRVLFRSTSAVVLSDLQSAAVDRCSAAVIVDAEVIEEKFATAALSHAGNSTDSAAAREHIIGVGIDGHCVRKNSCVQANIERAGRIIERDGIEIEENIGICAVKPIRRRADVPRISVI